MRKPNNDLVSEESNLCSVPQISSNNGFELTGELQFLVSYEPTGKLELPQFIEAVQDTAELMMCVSEWCSAEISEETERDDNHQTISLNDESVITQLKMSISRLINKQGDEIVSSDFEWRVQPSIRFTNHLKIKEISTPILQPTESPIKSPLNKRKN